jgi:large subunit ribosomal protein L11
MDRIDMHTAKRSIITEILLWAMTAMSFLRHVNLRVPAGAARPGPAIGQALGPLGINMAEFCQQFNEVTESTYAKENPLQVQLAALSDRSFTFKVRSPPTSYLVKKAAGVTKGPASVNPEIPIGYITPEAVYEIAKLEIRDDHRRHLPLEGVAWSVIGTAKSIGIHVREASEEQNDADETVSEGN